MEVILIGPMQVGKSTIARLLSTRLGLPRRGLDKKRWEYFAEIGYDSDHVQQLSNRGDVDAVLHYWKRFEVHAIERHVAANRNCVIDLGAGYSVQVDPVLSERVRRALAPFDYVVLLIPSADDAESIASLEVRVPEHLHHVNEHYIRHPSNRQLAKTIVYTREQTPGETCDAILGGLTKGHVDYRR